MCAPRVRHACVRLPARLQAVAVEGEELEADEAAEQAEDGHKGAVEQQVPGVGHRIVDAVAEALQGRGEVSVQDACCQQQVRQAWDTAWLTLPLRPCRFQGLNGQGGRSQLQRCC